MAGVGFHVTIVPFSWTDTSRLSELNDSVERER